MIAVKQIGFVFYITSIKEAIYYTQDCILKGICAFNLAKKLSYFCANYTHND
jgi:hypothetical protein